jgi:hypothetical protein
LAVGFFAVLSLIALAHRVAAQNATPAIAPEAQQSDDSLDAELLEGLEPAAPDAQIHGEDLGASENPLERMAGQMRDVESSLRSGRLGPPTQRLQQDILSDLDRLIAEQEKKCQGGGKPKPGSGFKPSAAGQQSGSTPKPGDPSQDGKEPGDTQKPSQTGAQAAADSQDGTRDGKEAKVDLAATQDLLKKVWGHLPAHMRDQMRQNANDRFLPKYEREIADYFRRLIDLEQEANRREPPKK